MKKVVFLVMVTLLALPGLAWANPCYGSAEFQAIGELDGSYQVGCIDVYQRGSLKTYDQATHEYTSKVVPTGATSNLFEIKQSTYSDSTFDGCLTVKQKAAMGANDMFMKGGAAFSGEKGFLPNTGFYQNQYVSMGSSFNGCALGCQGVGGWAYYGASQTFQAQAP